MNLKKVVDIAEGICFNANTVGGRAVILNNFANPLVVAPPFGLGVLLLEVEK